MEKMTVKQLIKTLQDAGEANPEVLDFEVLSEGCDCIEAADHCEFDLKTKTLTVCRPEHVLKG